MIQFYEGDPVCTDAMWRCECASVAAYCVGTGCDPGAGTRTLRADTVRVDLFAEYEPNHVGDATALPFPDGTYDYVFNSHLLEHLADPRAAIGEWLRIVKPGGVVAMVIPDTRFTKGMNTDRTPHRFEWDPETFAAEVLGWEPGETPWFERRGALDWAAARVESFGVACDAWSFHVVLRKS